MRISLPWWIPAGSAPEVTPEQLHAWLAEGRPVQIFDARTGLEYAQGTIGGARHAPLTEMPGSLKRQPIDPQRPVVMLCLSGHRSLPGARWLRARGVEAYSLRGGVLAWKGAGYRLNPPQEK